MTRFQKKLTQLKACEPAKTWVGTKTYKEAWDTCERVDWLRRLCEAPLRAEYYAKVVPLLAEYYAKVVPLWDEYENADHFRSLHKRQVLK